MYSAPYFGVRKDPAALISFVTPYVEGRRKREEEEGGREEGRRGGGRGRRRERDG
jgi:hypothetical protein